jgi:outer membrane protein assembly factor BamD
MHTYFSFLRSSVFFASLTLIPLIGARSVEAKRGRAYDCTGRISKAIEQYEKGRFSNARTILEDVKYQCGGHPAMDTALYYLGKARLELNNSIEARVEFERLTQEFPESAYADEAGFLLGYCSYEESLPANRDQTKTHEAIRELTQFIDRRPDSPFADSARVYLSKAREKLAKKELMNAQFYEKIDKHESAIVYYRSLLDEYPDSQYAQEAQLALAEALARVNRAEEAEEELNDLLGNDLPSAVRKKARALRTRLKSSGSSEAAVAE